MDLKRCLRAWAFVGAIIFVADVSRGSDSPAVQRSSMPVTLSTAALTEPATGAAPGLDEPFVSPMGLGKGKMVSGFGKRKRPVPGDFIHTGETTVDPLVERHEGIDFAVVAGAPVMAARSGKVLFAGFSKVYTSRKDKADQAHFIIIQHSDGKSSRYVHLSTTRVRPMQMVASGQMIGTVAESDECNVPVLHFEIRGPGGTPLNPEKLLSELKK